MIRYILKRLLIAIPVLLGITILDYFIMSLAGNPMEMMIGPRITQAAIEERAALLGLDKPILVQYWNWLKEALQGNFGYSFKQNLAVTRLIGNNVAPTVLLMGLSLVLSMLIAIPAGIYSAVHQYSKTDYAIVTASFIGSSVPSFFLALTMVYFFNLRLGWLPSSGMTTLGTAWSLTDTLRHMVLPVGVMVFSVVGVNIRYIRASMLEIMEQDYLRTAKAKGIGRRRVINKHALRNALLPIITIFGMQIPMLFSGSVVIEQVFSWPGLGLLTMSSILNRDYPLIMGVSLLSAVVVLIANLVTDILYAIVDPTIQYT
ncbi:MAG: ABC transporter permease [Clostridia bacterium]|nr:ABC transporter permease [Clostridia bacterium]